MSTAQLVRVAVTVGDYVFAAELDGTDVTVSSRGTIAPGWSLVCVVAWDAQNMVFRDVPRGISVAIGYALECALVTEIARRQAEQEGV